jgi:hypothetical protein
MPKLGRYETIEELGRGGTSVVYRARDTATDREVAVKVLSSHLLQDPDLLARFEREIKLAVRLEHPHIVNILDVGTEGQYPYIVMRLLAGGSLSDRIRQGPLSAADTVRILQEVASALDEAHRLNIVHRDLKPSNILFDQRGTAYLADFGVARLMDSADSLTASAGVVGTPAYMSPEQLKGQPVTGLADQYALGLVGFQALTARLPFEGTTAQMILQQLQEPLPSVRRYNAGLSPNFERVLARATAKDPAARYATTSEFAAALAAAAAEAPPLAVLGDVKPSLITEHDIALMTPVPVSRALAELVAPAEQNEPLPQPAPTHHATQPAVASRSWVGVGLVIIALTVLIGLGWQSLAAATPIPPAPTITATVPATQTASVTPAPSTTSAATEAAGMLITLDPDAVALAVVELPPGLAAASLHDEPQGAVLAALPDQSLVQVLRGRETTPDGVAWVRVRLLTGEVGWMVESLLRYLTETTVEATAAASPTTGAAATRLATGAAPTASHTQAAGQSTALPSPTAGAPVPTQPPSTSAPMPTPQPPPSATTPPPANTVPPPTATETAEDPTDEPVCNLLPILCP